jgi:hypothetical protein
MNIENLADKVRADHPLEDDERELISRILMAIGQQYYEKTGAMFICGHGGKTIGEMPEILMVCPRFGADFRDTFYYRLEEKKP